MCKTLFVLLAFRNVDYKLEKGMYSAKWYEQYYICMKSIVFGFSICVSVTEEQNEARHTR